MDIYKTDGLLLTSVIDGDVDTSSTSISLPGRNTAGYGQILNTNLVHLLENFASSSEPLDPMIGQVWYDTAAEKLKVYTATNWAPLAIAFSGVEIPSNPNIGETWWDTTRQQLKIWNGTIWKLIGPGYEQNWGQSGAFAELLRDSNGVDHVVVTTYVGGLPRLIVSQDPEYSLQTPIGGFDLIRPGINISRLMFNFSWRGNADNALSLGSVPANSYVRKDVDSTITANLTVNGLNVGSSRIDSSPTNLNFLTGTDRGIEFIVNQTSLLELTPSGEILVKRDPISDAGVASKYYVDQADDTLNSRITTETQNLTSLIEETADTLNSSITAVDDRVTETNTTVSEIQVVLDSKADKESPVFTGIPRVPTQEASTSNNIIASTEFVQFNRVAAQGYTDSSIAQLSGSLTNLITNSLSLKANIDSPQFTGIPTVPTPAPDSNNVNIANTAWVKSYADTNSRWQGSQKFVSTTDPEPGVNDLESRPGDFWFKYAT